MRKALLEPLRWIADNAGSEGYVVAAKVRELPADHGLDAATGEYVDLVAAGIVDPVKVTKAALANAASSPGCCSPRRARSSRSRPSRSPSTGHGHGHSHGPGGHMH